MDTEINSRLKQIVKWAIYTGKVSSATEFAKSISKTPSALSALTLGKTIVTDKTVAMIIASYPELNINWLLTGKGSMLLNKPSTDAISASLPSNQSLIREGDLSSVELLSMLKTKDNQLSEKDRQIANMQEQLANKDKQIQLLFEMIFKRSE